MPLVHFQEDIMRIQVCEQPDNFVEPVIRLIGSDALETRLQLVVEISCQMRWCLLVSPHKILKCCVAPLLKLSVVVEAGRNQFIHLRLQFKKLD